jgi:hypothetical protein
MILRIHLRQDDNTGLIQLQVFSQIIFKYFSVGGAVRVGKIAYKERILVEVGRLPILVVK